jgi:YD repeat-containing protein
MRATLLLLILGFSSGLFSQERYQVNKVIPPSPTAASLGKYGEMPVSFYTGQANVSIPLYTIHTNNFNLPISLQYNSSGIKVSQEASWVGLGWSLFGGGVITRSIRGLEDLYTFGGYNNTPELPAPDEFNEYIFNTWADVDYLEDVANKVIDPEPDQFFYNFNGTAGKFVIGKEVNGSPVIVADQNNFKIVWDKNFATSQYPSQLSGQWIITTPDGFKYFFRTVEMSEDYYSNSDITSSNMHGLEPVFTRSYNEQVTSWYLDLIQSPNGEELSFEYDFDRSLSAISKSVTQYDLTYPTGSTGNAPPMSSKYAYYNASRQVIKDVYLKKIIFQGGYVKFNRASRIDIEPHPLGNSNPSRLSEMIVYDGNNEQLRKCTFQYSYFDENTVSNIYNWHYKRLKLDAVTEEGKTSTPSIPPYRFTYFDETNLPGKYSTQVDAWGFYSSFYSPTLPGEFSPTLLPQVTTSTWIGNVTFPGTNRPADEWGNFSKRGMLASIKYPTGGKTEFEYEVNTYEVPLYTIPGTRTEIAKAISNYVNPNETNLVSNFYTSGNVSFSLIAYPQWDDTSVQSTDVVAWLKNSSNTVIETFSLSTANKTVNLPTGNYSLVVDEIVDYYISLTAYYQNPPTTSTTKKGAGLRIKSITNRDYDNNKISTKKYEYGQGILISKPIYNYFDLVHIAGSAEDIHLGQWPVSTGSFLVRMSTTAFPIGFNSNSNLVGYRGVTEIEGESGQGGRTEYGYFSEADIIASNTLPGVPTMGNLKNGKLLYKIVKDKLGNAINKTSYTYELKNSVSINGFKMYRPIPEALSPGANTWLFSYQTKYYQDQSEWWVRSEEVDENYFGGNTVSHTKTFHYNNSTHKQLTSQEETLSDGSIVTTVFKYPTDFSSQAPYGDMVTKHMIAPVVEQIASKGSTPLASSRTNFNNWGSFIAPITIDSKKGSGSYITRLRYHNYDNKGNVTSVSKENDMKTSYLWGYNKTYPIIKADNITSAQLETAVGNALTAMGYSGISGLDLFLRDLGIFNFASNKTSLKTFITLLESQLSSYKTLFTFNTYDPLTGVTSETDANNRTNYYTYDDIGRLTVVTDNDGNIVKTYKYNFRQ